MLPVHTGIENTRSGTFRHTTERTILRGVLIVTFLAAATGTHYVAVARAIMIPSERFWQNPTTYHFW